MARFGLECPYCGTVNRASTFILAKKVITCDNCKNTIDVKANRMAIGHCDTCGNVAFDQAKNICPICKKSIAADNVRKANSVEDLEKFNTTPIFNCPECGCSIQASKQGDSLICPVCDHKFDGYGEVFQQIQKSKLVSDTGISVLKYEGDNETFVWKHPIEDFNLGSQLIVHESQEAIFFLNGQALDLFGPGRYTLETENLPVLKKMQMLPTGKQTPFHAEVYFINKTVQMGIKWGTDSRVRFIEPNTGIPLDIGASGELNLQVADSRKLLVKLVGTANRLVQKQVLESENDTAGTQKTLRSLFRAPLMTVIKSYLAATIKAENINILEIEENLVTLSNGLRPKLSEAFEEYGLTVPQFYVTNVVLPEEDPNFIKLRELLAASYLGVRQAEVEASIVAAGRQQVIEKEKTELERAKFEAMKKRIAAEAEAEVIKQTGMAEAQIMSAKGYNQRDVLQADVQKAYAQGIGQMGGNGGAGGGVVSDIVGLGVGIAAAGNVGAQFTDAFKGFNAQDDRKNEAPSSQETDTWKCSCGYAANLGKFCSDCGKPKPELWDCPNCGAKDVRGKFCSDCGAPKPELWDCPNCGAKANSGKFCSECGKGKDVAETWDCSCGNKNVKGKFCPECGKGKEGNN